MKHSVSLLVGSLLLLQGLNAAMKYTLPKFGKYFIPELDTPVTFFEAWQKCNDKDMKLLSIGSKAEEKALRDRLVAGNTVDKSWRFWTSGVDSQNDKVFWLDRSVVSTYVNWKSGKPGGEPNICVFLNYDFSFVDYSCDVLCRYICEADLLS